MSYKTWASTRAWLPKGKTLYLLKSMPKGPPQLLRPDHVKMLTVQRLADCYTSMKARLPDEEQQWWRQFISSEVNYRKVWEDTRDDELMKMAEGNWFFDHLHECEDVRRPKSAAADTDTKEREIDRLIAKHNTFPLHSGMKIMSK